MRILFVCTGNICRSPTAHGVLEHMAATAGLALNIDSAGIYGYHAGEAPDSRTLTTARTRGYEFGQQRSRKVTAQDFEQFDLIFAMDKGHLRELKNLCPPAHQHKLHLYLQYTLGREGAEVPDPYYGGQQGFDHVLNLTEQASKALLAKL